MCAITMPKLTRVEQLHLRPGEVFVAAGGFEERALAFSEMVMPCRKTSSKALVLKYLPRDAENRFPQLCAILNARHCEAVPITYNRRAPGSFDTRLRRALTELDADAVCVDISGMSRLAMMIILDVARELNLVLRIVYAEALEYAPSREDFERAKASKEQHQPTTFIHTGLYDVLRVDRLSSIRMQNHAAVLIAFDSFNEALCQALVNVINPSRFVLINGRPPRKKLSWREEATAYVHRRLREEWSVEDDNAPIRTTSTLLYEETYQLLVVLYWKFSAAHRIIIAPTGSKMQAIGAYLLHAVHPDIHVEYPTVEGFFAAKYSTGVRDTWELDFGNMGDFVTRLRYNERKRYLDLPEEPVEVDIV